ncbi:hypothetical protein PENSPDRAFT_595123 [Peniophora sp. CONT]|nr:hypothetical protein PENSPDRAFT_595123 [Peniophora sp. CONT]
MNLRNVALALQRSSSTSQTTQNEIQRTRDVVPHSDFSPSGIASPTITAWNTVGTAVDRHRKLAIDYEHVLKAVRKQRGFEDFLHAPKIKTLLPSIEHLDGPVVFINVHSSSCDALALSPNGGIKRIVLHRLTESQAQDLRSTWTRFLRSSGLRMRGAVSIDRLISKRTNMLGVVLERVWTWIVHPILEALNFFDDTPSRSHRLPHVTWCPTGPLTQLPLHAAGIYDRPAADRLHVYDHVVSSYTPSLAALLRCHKQPGTHQVYHPNVLVIAQPKTPGYAELPYTRDECERLRAVMPKYAHTVLLDKQGTVEHTLAAMNYHQWVHIACHGTQDAVDPTQSKFALYDGPLTLGALMTTVADSAELAFLSACQTAVGNKNIPEESAHLAAGMLAVGFKGVVGTMWSIYDADAPIVVEAYYKRLHKLRKSKKPGIIPPGYTGSAYALHWAMKVLRERVGEQNFVKWAPFVHFGV